MKLREHPRLLYDPHQRGNSIQSRPCADRPCDLKGSFGKDPIACPAFTRQPAAQGDQVRFKGKVNHAKPCCVNRIKAGKSLGCCGGDTQEEFKAKFERSIQETIDEKGVPPKLDEDVKKILNGDNAKSSTQSNPQAGQGGDCCPMKKEVSVAEQARLKEPVLKRFALAPFRWLKWLATGFWEDLRLLFKGDEK